MSARVVSWLAWSICAVTLLVLALAMLLIVLGWSTPLPRGWTPWRDQTVSMLGLVCQWLGETYAAYALVVDPGSLAAPRTISHVLQLGGQVALTLVPLLMLLFPTGRLPSPRWRPLVWVSTTAGAVLLLLVLFFDDPD